MAGMVQFASPGCIVEYFEASAAQIGIVTEESGGRLRLLLPNRRETKLPSSRILPWMGPVVSGFAGMSMDAKVKAVEAARTRREEIAAQVPVQELWEMAQGEVSVAPARWFAELMDSDPDADTVAGYAHALLQAKTLFRFSPPSFEVYSAEVAQKREEELAKQRERERIVSEGCPFVRALWNAVGRRTQVAKNDIPSEPVAKLVERLLFARMADPETQEEDSLWRMLTKGLPEVPHLPVQLLEAWGRVPPHYNFWYDRAGYDPSAEWWKSHAEEAAHVAKAATGLAYPACDLPFVSIDGESTRDIDDAFFIEARDDGSMTVSIALACPAAVWPFGSPLDKTVLHRGTSIYLPEGDSHMMPEFLSTDALSLVEGAKRPSFVLTQDVAADGTVQGECRLGVFMVSVRANLRYPDCQAVLDGHPAPDSQALPYAELLQLGKKFCQARVAARIASGAVQLLRSEPKVVLEGEGWETKVRLEKPVPAEDAQDMVAEMMILANAAVADWAVAHAVPLIYRSQDVALPKEYAGVWAEPQDITRIMRAMVPSILDVQPRPHAALGLERYAPVTSPLRRYADLINESQILAALQGEPRLSEEELVQLLLSLSVALDGAGQIQRFRPRYWKLLYFRQMGDRHWWRGIVTEDNDTFVSVSLPEEDIFVRGRRRLFDDRTCPGMPVAVRIGKVNPLYNELQIVEALPADSLPEEDFQC